MTNELSLLPNGRLFVFTGTVLYVCSLTSASTSFQGWDDVTKQLLEMTSWHTQMESRPSLRPSSCRPEREDCAVTHHLFVGRRAAGNVVLTHDGSHTGASEQEGGSVCTVWKIESGWVVVGFFFLLWGGGPRKRVLLVARNPYHLTHTHEQVELQCVPVSLLILFPLPPPFLFTVPINAIPSCYL